MEDLNLAKPVKVREKWIDNAKGIAMILVIIGHVSGGLTGIWNFNWVYGVHLFAFFLLSGYTLKKKPFTREYINNKFNRLMVPYFWTCLALSITNIWNSWFLAKDSSISTISKIIGKDIIISFFASGAIKTFGSVNIGADIGAIWFLPALFFALLIMEILLNINDNDWFLGISTSLIALIAFITAKFIWFPFSIQAGMFASFFLWMGYEIKKHKILDKICWYHYTFALIILIFGIHFGYCNVGFVAANISDPWISLPVGLSGCLLIYLISRIDKGNILAYIGRISLTILCVHLYALNTLGGYFGKAFDRLSLEGNLRVWATILVEVAFAIIVAAIIENLKQILSPVHALLQRKSGDTDRSDTDITLNIEQGIFASILLISYFPIDERLRTILYSCHVVIFIFIAGYRHGNNKLSISSVGVAARTYLIPYAVAAVLDMLMHFRQWSPTYLKMKAAQYIVGISATKRILSDIPSVGPVYLLFVLFICELLYMAIDRMAQDRKMNWIVTILVSLIGMMLGTHGFWLPWSVDIACYALIFYKLGCFCREKGILKFVQNTNALYFILSSVWAYMIYCGGMEIASRDYGQYGMVVMGAVSGILVVFQFAFYMEKHLPIVRALLSVVGRSYVAILIIYTLFHTYIEHLVSGRFDGGHFVFWTIVVALELLAGTMIGIALNVITRFVGRKKRMQV